MSLRVRGRMLRRSVLLVVMALAAVGCGSGSDGGDAAGGEATSVTSPASESPGSESEASGEAWRIGAVYALTGGASFLGESEQAAAELAVEQANADGGVDGHPIELAIEDSESTEQGAVLATQQFVDEGEVAAILGPSTTGEALAAIPIANDGQIPLLPHVSGVDVIEPIEERAFIFRPGQGGDLSATKVLEYLEENGLSSLGVLYVGNAYGEDGRDNIQSLAGDFGVSVDAVESFPPDATDLKSQLTNITNAGVDAIFVHGVGAPSVVAYTDAQALGIEVPVISGHGQANSAFREGVGDAVHGQPIVGAPVLVADQLPDSHPQHDIVTEFHDAYGAAYGEEPDMFAGVAYDATNMILDAMAAVGNDPVAIRDWLETEVKDWVGVTGVFNFTPEDHGGLTPDALIMTTAVAEGWDIAEYEAAE